MTDERPLYIPILLGTTRKGQFSEYVAQYVLGRAERMHQIEAEIIDIATLELRTDGAGEEVQDPRYGAAMARMDGLIIVTPEYNHGYPGLLKHVLDTCLKEYIHKPVALCGVSGGGFGGTRVIENLLPVMRELGLVTIFWDGTFSNVRELFDESGRTTNEALGPAIDRMLVELVWMARVLRYGRENLNMERQP